jgi:TonB family protein
MLEQVIHQPRAGLRWRGPLAVFSVVAHAAALTAVIGAGMWRLEKLPPIDSAVTFVASIGVSIPQEGPPKVEQPTPPRERVVTTTHQPTDRRREAATPTSEQPPGTDTGAEHPGTTPSLLDMCPPGADCTPAILQDVEAPVCGNGQVEPGETCDDGGTSAGDGCSPTCRAEPVVVAQRAIEAQRIAGDPQIAAPDSVRAQMARAQQAQVRADVKMCLGKGGDVTSVRVLRSTGYAEYDTRLTERMRGWRYRPFQVNGAAVPVCSVVTFVYRME